MLTLSNGRLFLTDTSFILRNVRKYKKKQKNSEDREPEMTFSSWFCCCLMNTLPTSETSLFEITDVILLSC